MSRLSIPGTESVEYMGRRNVCHDKPVRYPMTLKSSPAVMTDI